MKTIKRVVLIICSIHLLSYVDAQEKIQQPEEIMEKKGNDALNSVKDLRIKLNENGSHYVKFTALNQVWIRYTDANPGTTINGFAKDQIFDIGIRRLRFQILGQLTDQIFFYVQFGQNNFSHLSAKYTGAFFHDAIVEYSIIDKHISIGGGLTGWSGLSRYASPSIGSIMSLDAPLFQQATNGVNDQFLRKLSIYAKGKIGKLDYRIALTDPLSVDNSLTYLDTSRLNIAAFSPKPAALQTQGYFMYQFLNQEANTTPYTVGTYLGSKDIFNIGAGFIYQPNAMWYLSTVADTVSSTIQLLGVDIFWDHPLNKEKGNAITIYAVYNTYNFGPNYMRNVGVMNPANGNNNVAIFNGGGNAFPMIATGSTIYAQVGYLFKDNLLPKNAKLQPYGAFQYGNYERLKDPMIMYEGGVNWYINGSHNSKMTINYQSRPIYETMPNGLIENISRKGMLQLQYQIAI